MPAFSAVSMNDVAVFAVSVTLALAAAEAGGNAPIERRMTTPVKSHSSELSQTSLAASYSALNRRFPPTNLELAPGTVLQFSPGEFDELILHTTGLPSAPPSFACSIENLLIA